MRNRRILETITTLQHLYEEFGDIEMCVFDEAALTVKPVVDIDYDKFSDREDTVVIFEVGEEIR